MSKKDGRTQKQKYSDYVKQIIKTNETSDMTGGCVFRLKDPESLKCNADIIGKPVIFLNGDKEVQLEVNEYYYEPGAYSDSASIVSDIKIFSSLDKNKDGSYDTSTLGNYEIIYYALNTYGFTNYVTRNVRIITSIPAEITLIGNSEISLERYYDNYIEEGVNISHIYDISNTLTIDGFIDISNVGSYTLTYTATTHYNISSSVQRLIKIIDTTGPELELIGSGKTIDSPLYVLRYSQYNDPGITILKGTTYNIDLNNLNMNILGIYTIIYTAVDEFNNATQITRYVSVEPNIKPIIQISDNYENLTLEKYIEKYKDVENPPPATDINDNLTIFYKSTFSTPNVIIQYGFLTSVVSNVDVTNVGSYIITYNAGSNIGLESTKIINVTVIDPVIIDISGDNPMTIERYTDYIEPGIFAYNRNSVFINTIQSISNLNNRIADDGYTILYQVLDYNFNILDTATRIINVVDTKSPIITLNGNSVVDHEKDFIYIDQGAIAIDQIGNVDYTNNIVVTSDVCYNIVGTYTVRYNVSDDEGNEAEEVTRTVNVIDTTQPVIILNNNNTYLHEKYTPFVDPGYTAIDFSNIDLTENVIRTFNINKTIPKKTFVLKA